MTDWSESAEQPDGPAADDAVEVGAVAPVEAAEPAASADVPAEVADAAEVLDGLAERPLAEHAEVYEELHSRLQRTLAEIDGG